jgi:hypothetical protein
MSEVNKEREASDRVALEPPPPLGEHVRLWNKFRFWLEPSKSNQKKIIGSKVENTMWGPRFRLVARSNIGKLDPVTATVLDYVYAFIVPRTLMTRLLDTFKQPRVVTHFRNKSSKLATSKAGGTRFLNIGDPLKFPLLTTDQEAFLFNLEKISFAQATLDSEWDVIEQITLIL